MASAQAVAVLADADVAAVAAVAEAATFAPLAQVRTVVVVGTDVRVFTVHAGLFGARRQLMEDGPAARAYRARQYEQNDAPQDLTLKELRDTGDRQDHGDDPQDECHACRVPVARLVIPTVTSMGRPPSMWLQRAYEILADGEWHDREKVVREMMRAVPPGRAYRHGHHGSMAPDTVHPDHLRHRGARHLCQQALNNAGYIEQLRLKDGSWLIRAVKDHGRTPSLPRLILSTTALEATHVLIPIEDWRTHRTDKPELVKVSNVEPES